MNYIEEYYAAIVSGSETVSDKVRRTYRHLVNKLNDTESPYQYDEDAANYAMTFIETFCCHSKGKWAGQPIRLELWEKALVSALFGFKQKATGLRQYRELILLIGRKNGKSLLGSALGNFLLMADGEGGPEIYSVATKKDQAKIIWNESVRMIKHSPALNRHAKCLVSKIKTDYNNGTFEPLGSDSMKLDGLNVHGALIDELHAIKDKNLYDVVVDGMSARTQPLSIITSTAGTVRDNIFDLKYDECRRLIDGYDDPKGYHDETVLPIIYELDERSEWTNPACWKKANPGLGTIKNEETLANKVERAKANPLLVKNLLCKDFNVRETASQAFFTFEELNNEATFDIKALCPRYGIYGADLSQTTDLTCATLLFKVRGDPIIYVKQKYWIPEDLFEQRIREDNVPYDIWHDQGYIDLSPGNKIDYRLLVKWFQLEQQEDDVFLYKLGFDRWSATYFVQDVEEKFGKPVLDPVAQGVQTLSAPMKALKADLAAKRINYGNNPVLKWCMANTSVIEDRNGNIQPCKVSGRNRIDGFASLLDAYVTFLRFERDYENII